MTINALGIRQSDFQAPRHQGGEVTDPIRQIGLDAFLSHGTAGPADWMSKQKKKNSVAGGSAIEDGEDCFYFFLDHSPLFVFLFFVVFRVFWVSENRLVYTLRFNPILLILFVCATCAVDSFFIFR